MKIKYSILLLITILLSTSSYEQDMTSAYAGELDLENLKKELTVVKDDSSRALVLIRLAELYRGWNPDTSFYYGQKALELSRRIDYPALEAYALISLSHYFATGGDLTQALELGLKGLNIGKENDLRVVQLAAMIRIGSAYVNMRSYQEALQYYRQTLLTATTNDSFFRAVAFWRSADIYEHLNIPDSVIYYAKLAEDLANQMGKMFIVRGVAPSLGTAYAKKGNDELAIRYLNLNRGPLGLTALAAYHKDRGRYDSAKYYAHQAFDIANRNKGTQEKLTAATLLASLYESDDPRTALYFQKIVMANRDSLYGAEKVLSATTVAFKEKEQQNEMRISDLAYRNKIRIYASLAGLAVAIFIALLLFRNNRKERKANTLLQQQKEEITRTLSELKRTQSQLVQSEKMASLGELTAGIAHEIQNPLNFVNNFSEVNNELIEEIKNPKTKLKDEELNGLLNDIYQNNEKINFHGKRADSIVKSMLQHSRASTGHKELTDVNALCDEYLRLAYHGMRAKDKSFNVTLKTHFDSSIEKIILNPQEMGRVILNLVNNAIYAVTERKKISPNGYEPMVMVSTAKFGNKIEIRVEDNGQGIPQNLVDKIFQPFFTTKAAGQGTGLGLSLAYDIIKAHGGDIKVETKENEGVAFMIYLPVS